jgi:hypothetical protein
VANHYRSYYSLLWCVAQGRASYRVSDIGSRNRCNGFHSPPKIYPLLTLFGATMELPTALIPDQIYSTAQVAGLLGISEGTLRSRKSREKDALIEGHHWLQQDGSTFWTVRGILEIAQRIDNPTAKAILEQCNGILVPTTAATPIAADPAILSVAEAATNCVAPDPSPQPPIAIDIQFLEPLLEVTGQGLALEFYRRLPEYVLKHIQRLAIHPTDAERQVIQTAFQPIQRLQQEVPEQCGS